MPCPFVRRAIAELGRQVSTGTGHLLQAIVSSGPQHLWRERSVPFEETIRDLLDKRGSSDGCEDLSSRFGQAVGADDRHVIGDRSRCAWSERCIEGLLRHKAVG